MSPRRLNIRLVVVAVVVAVCIGTLLLFSNQSFSAFYSSASSSSFFLSPPTASTPSSDHQEEAETPKDSSARHHEEEVVVTDSPATTTTTISTRRTSSSPSPPQNHSRTADDDDSNVNYATILPRDARTLKAPSKLGGLNLSFSHTHTWILVKREAAYRWWAARYGPVIGLGSGEEEEEARAEWSCGIGRVRPAPSSLAVLRRRGLPGGQPRTFFKFWTKLPRPQDLGRMGPGWNSSFDTPGPEFLAQVPRRTRRVLESWGAALPPLRSWDPIAQYPTCEMLPGGPWGESAAVKEYVQVLEGSGIELRDRHESAAAAVASPPPSVAPSSVQHLNSSAKDKQQRQYETSRDPADMGLASFSRNQARLHCAEDVLLLDGRAPSFAQALSRRCKNITKLRERRLFFAGVGHSHTRYLFGTLCMLGNHSSCGDWSKFHFHMPIYPVKADSFWERQMVPTGGGVVEEAAAMPVVNQSAAASSSSPQQPAPPPPPRADSSQRLHFRLFYSASWYDSRVALVRMIERFIDPQTRARFETFPAPIVSPELQVFHVSHLGRGGNSSQNNNLTTAVYDDMIRTWVAKVRPYFAVQEPTHFVVSRGEWDAHYLSPRLDHLTRQFAEFLELLNELFPDAVVVLQLPQRHIQFPATKENPLQPFRLICASNARIRAMREMNLCAAHLAIKKRDGLKRKLVLFDSDTVTKSYMGSAFIDRAGHHFGDVPLEFMANELRHIASDDSVQQWLSYRGLRKLELAAETACPRILNNSLPYAPPWLDQVSRPVVEDFERANILRNSPGVKMLSYSEYLGFPPRHGRPEVVCTCHSDKPMNQTFCDEWDHKLPGREFVLYNQILRNRKLKKQLRAARAALELARNASFANETLWRNTMTVAVVAPNVTAAGVP